MTVFNRAGLVFIGRRTDGPEHVDAAHVWQMPQGGIDEGEDPYKAALRELHEETNIRSVQKLGEIGGWLTYDLPSDVAKQAWGGNIAGRNRSGMRCDLLEPTKKSILPIPAAGTNPNSSSGVGLQCVSCRNSWCPSSASPTNVS